METAIDLTNVDEKKMALHLQQKIPGYGFQPTGEELINYLKSEERGCRGCLCIIPTLENVYGIDPWDLPDKFNEQSIIPSNHQEWWFVCPQPQNRGISRKTPCGLYWKITGKPTDVKPRNEDREIGSKKTLVFPSNGPTDWVIHEYHLLNNNHLDGYYVLCHLMDKRAEMASLRSFLDQSDDEGSLRVDLIQAMMNSLIENNEGPSVMDLTMENGLTDEYMQLEFETSEEDEDVGYLLNDDPIDANFFQGDQMQTLENRRTRTMDSVHGVVPLEEKKGMVENKFSGSLVGPQKPTAPPVCAAGAKYYGKDEVRRFKKVKQETADKSIKPENIFSDETAARAKDGQISVTENGQTRTIGSFHGVVPLEQKKGAIQSQVSSTKSSTNPPRANLVNVLVGIFLLFAITCQVFKI